MSRREYFKFRLYVAGNAGNAVTARENINSICRAHLSGRYEIELVDVFNEPRRAVADVIVMTPTLIKLLPAPVCRIVGTLSEAAVVLAALGLPKAAI